jgi:hypothetical protein
MKAPDFIRVFFPTTLIPQVAQLVSISQFSPMKFANLERELVFRTRGTVHFSEACFVEKKRKRLKTMDAYQSFGGIQHADN